MKKDLRIIIAVFGMVTLLGVVMTVLGSVALHGQIEITRHTPVQVAITGHKTGGEIPVGMYVPLVSKDIGGTIYVIELAQTSSRPTIGEIRTVWFDRDNPREIIAEDIHLTIPIINLIMGVNSLFVGLVALVVTITYTVKSKRNIQPRNPS